MSEDPHFTIALEQIRTLKVAILEDVDEHDHREILATGIQERWSNERRKLQTVTEKLIAVSGL